jgi:outer membrane protein assembly factor BamB
MTHTLPITVQTVLKLALAMAAFAVLSACSSDKLPPAPLSDFKPSTGISRVWALPLTGGLNAQPTVLRAANGAQLLVAQGDTVAAYQAQSGAAVWSAKLGLVQAPLGVSADGTSVLALVQGEEAVSLDAATGAVRWRNPLPAEMRVQPASVGGVFVVLTADGRLVGMEQATGRRIWVIGRVLPALTVRGTGAIAALSGTVAAVGLPGGKTIGVNATNGAVVWEINLAQPKGVTEVERIADVLPNWVAQAGLGLCASSYNQRSACVDERGQVSYAQDMNARSGLVSSDGQWFAMDGEDTVKAWKLKPRAAALAPALAGASAAADSAEWVFTGLKGRTGNSLQSLAAFGGAVFVQDNLGVLHVLSATNGQTIARVNTGTGADANVMPVVVGDKGVLIVADSKSISAWQPAQ